MFLSSIFQDGGIVYLPETMMFCNAVTLLSTLVPCSDAQKSQQMLEICETYLKQDTLPMESRSSVMYMLSQLILHRQLIPAYTLSYIEKAASIVSQSQSSTASKNLLIATF